MSSWLDDVVQVVHFGGSWLRAAQGRSGRTGTRQCQGCEIGSRVLIMALLCGGHRQAVK